MGQIKHHTIVVTGMQTKNMFDGEDVDQIEEVHYKAKEEYFDLCQVSPLLHRTINGYRSFFVAPDGSKEGWGHSHKGEREREAFINYLKENTYSDGSSPVRWCFVQYGDDHKEDKMIDSVMKDRTGE